DMILGEGATWSVAASNQQLFVGKSSGSVGQILVFPDVHHLSSNSTPSHVIQSSILDDPPAAMLVDGADNLWTRSGFNLLDRYAGASHMQNAAAPAASFWPAPGAEYVTGSFALDPVSHRLFYNANGNTGVWNSGPTRTGTPSADLQLAPDHWLRS